MIKKLLTGAIFSLLLLLPLAGAAPTSKVTLAWVLSVSPNIASQKMYFSNLPLNTATGQFPTPSSVMISDPTATQLTITGLASGTYYFAVTATNTSGLESLYSGVVSTTLNAPARPDPQTVLRILAPPLPR